CGQPAACRLEYFVEAHKVQVEAVAAGLEILPAPAKDKETMHRIDALRHLLTNTHGMLFDGKQCHRCGDALICLEAPVSHIIATKNRKHFEPIAQILDKQLAIPASQDE